MHRLSISAAVLLGAAMPLVFDSALKGLALLLVAGVAAILLWRASASARHLVWLVAVAALLVVPFLSVALPQWRVLPHWAVVKPESLLPAAAFPSVGATPVLSEGFAPLMPAEPAASASLPVESRPDNAEAPSLTLPPAASPAVQSPFAVPSETNAYRWMPLAWAGGCALLLVRLLVAHWLLRRASRACAVVKTGPLADALAAAAQQLKLKKPVRLLLDSRRSIPVIWGVFRPRLLLPAGAEKWDEPQLRSVLLHELAHIRRRDTLVQWLAQCACALHWFNPLVWVAAWRLHAERERACDNLVLNSGVRPSDYAGHLLHVASQYSPARWTAACGLAMAKKSRLEGRLLAVLSEKLNRRRVNAALAAVALILGAAVAIPVAMLQAGEKEGAAESKEENDSVAPRDSTAAILFKRWQDLEGKGPTLPETAVSRLRSAIEKWVNQPPAKPEAARVQALRDRDANLTDHKVADVAAWLDEIAAISRGPIEFAINGETHIGRKLNQENDASLKFGPVAENGLRAAWLRHPVKNTYVTGDIIYNTLVLQNTTDHVLEFKCPYSLQGIPWEITAGGEKVKMDETMLLGGIPIFGWKLQPGEVAEIAGYGLSIGKAAEREGPRKGFVSTVMHAKGGDHITARWRLRDPVPMTTGDVEFDIIDEKDVAVWPINRAGTWTLQNGVKLQVEQNIFHGADVTTSSTLLWPETKDRPALRHEHSVASDHFGNHVPWLMAWEKDTGVLWQVTAKARMRGNAKPAKEEAEHVSRLDFSNPENITLTYWNADSAPLPDKVRAALAETFTFPPFKEGRENQTPSHFCALLEHTWVVKSRTVDDKGHPLAGVPVQLALEESKNQPFESARSDADGWFWAAFRIPCTALRDGVHIWISARNDNTVKAPPGFKESGFSIGAAGLAEYVRGSKAAEGVVFSGTVTDNGGHPLPGALIAVRPEPAALTGLTTRADEKGKFTLAGVPTGMPVAVHVEYSKWDRRGVVENVSFVPGKNRAAKLVLSPPAKGFDWDLKMTEAVDTADASIQSEKTTVAESSSGLRRGDLTGTLFGPGAFRDGDLAPSGPKGIDLDKPFSFKDQEGGNFEDKNLHGIITGTALTLKLPRLGPLKLDYGISVARKSDPAGTGLEGTPMPALFQISGEKHSAIAVQSEKDVNFVLYHDGFLSRGMSKSETGDAGEKIWSIEGAVQIKAPGVDKVKREFRLLYSYDDPNTLFIDGKPYALKASVEAMLSRTATGRVFILRETGEPLQTGLTLPMRNAKDLETIAGLARRIQFLEQTYGANRKIQRMEGWLLAWDVQHTTQHSDGQRLARLRIFEDGRVLWMPDGRTTHELKMRGGEMDDLTGWLVREGHVPEWKPTMMKFGNKMLELEPPLKGWDAVTNILKFRRDGKMHGLMISGGPQNPESPAFDEIDKGLMKAVYLTIAGGHEGLKRCAAAAEAVLRRQVPLVALKIGEREFSSATVEPDGSAALRFEFGANGPGAGFPRGEIVIRAPKEGAPYMTLLKVWHSETQKIEMEGKTAGGSESPSNDSTKGTALQPGAPKPAPDGWPPPVIKKELGNLPAFSRNDYELILRQYAPYASTFDAKINAKADELMQAVGLDPKSPDKADMRKDMRELLIVSMMSSQFVKPDPVTADEKAAWLRAHPETARSSDRVKLWSITIPRKAPRDRMEERKDWFEERFSPADNGPDPALEKLAREIRAQLANGGDFSALAGAHSADSKREAGGDWGWVEEKDLAKEFWTLVSILEAGKISDVIRQGDNFYILRIEAREEGKVRTAAELDALAQSALEAEKRRKACAKWIDRMRSEERRKAADAENGPVTPLLDAAFAGDLEMVKQLLAAGADPNARTGDKNRAGALVGGITPLFQACKHGFYDVAKALLEGGAKVELARTANKRFPLFETLASASDEDAAVKLVTLLLDHGADPNEPEGHIGSTLHLAASRDLRKVMRLLVSRGAKLDTKMVSGQTPAQLAREKGSPGAAEFLEALSKEKPVAENDHRPHVRKRDDWSPEFLALSKTVADARGLANARPDDLIAWGIEDANGLRSGLLMAPAVNVYRQLPVMLVLRNLSAQPREVQLVWSWNATRVVAKDHEGKPLKVTNLDLDGIDAIHPVTLKPNEQIEMPGPPVQFGGTPPEGLAAYVQTTGGKVLLHFNLTNLPGPDTGEVVIQVTPSGGPVKKPVPVPREN